MKTKVIITIFIVCFFFNSAFTQSSNHEIIFCGEKIPVGDRHVADKLMNIIKKQINYVNMPELRKRVNKYFGIVEYYLRETGLPEDFKYLAIVESGFKENAVSSAKAVGFWQIMPSTAQDWGLIINEYIDERKDIYRATHAACKQLARNYLSLRKKFGISSWVLAAAAYNYGLTNISNAIMRQGKDYFQMTLNAETAAYVYKIIAVKELFEYPEIYMKNFGYNIFTASSTKPTIKEAISDTPSFSSMTLKLDKNEVKPVDLDTSNIVVDKSKIEDYKAEKKVKFGKVKFVNAQIIGKYKNFSDGDLVAIKLRDNLQVGNSFFRTGTIMQFQGWKIDDRVHIDLGFDKNALMYDLESQQGISVSSLKNKEYVVIMVNNMLNSF